MTRTARFASFALAAMLFMPLAFTAMSQAAQMVA